MDRLPVLMNDPAEHRVQGCSADWLWLGGLALSPLLYGSVVPEAQAVPALLLALACGWFAFKGGGPRRFLGTTGLVLLTLALLGPLIPLPGWVYGLDLNRRLLMDSFPPGAQAGSASGWTPLALAPAVSWQRSWELFVAALFFCIARAGGGSVRMAARFSLMICTTLLLLAASSLWMTMRGGDVILGLWKIPWGQGAGTFANRNFFASWCYMGCLAGFAWILRSFSPMQSMRTGTVSRHPGRYWFSGACMIAALLSGLAAALATGSRGAFLGFVVGLLVWLFFLVKRGRNIQRWILVSALLAAGFVLFGLGSSLLLERLGRVGADASGYPKLGIWKEALLLWTRFPLLGIGWGGFGLVVNHYKSFGAGISFLQAENDYVQLMAEAGIAGIVLPGCLFWFVLRPALGRLSAGRLQEPEFMIGALAGLVCLMVHSMFDFPAQIPALLWFGAALLGMLAATSGDDDPAGVLKPTAVRWPGLLAAAVLLSGGMAHLGAFYHWQLARRSDSSAERLASVERSLDLWPWNGRRTVAWVRAGAAVISSLPPKDRTAAWVAFRQRAEARMRWHRLDWEVRLELFAGEAAFNPVQSGLKLQAERLLKLNPLHPRLPIEIARIVSSTDRAFALSLLETASRNSAVQREVLEQVLRLTSAPELLWRFVPPGDAGLRTLVDFAMSKGLKGLAVQAAGLLDGPVSQDWLAGLYLAADRPDLVVGLKLPDDSRASRLLKAKALSGTGRNLEAWSVVDSILAPEARQGGLLHSTPVSTAVGDGSSAFAVWGRSRADKKLAWSAVQALRRSPPTREGFEKLLQISAAFPQDLAIKYQAYGLAREVGDLSSAVRIGIEIAAALPNLK